MNMIPPPPIVGKLDFQKIKEAAEYMAHAILPALTQLPATVLIKRSEDHPCPQCLGESVIWPAEDAERTGRIACRNCTNDKPTGDIIATVAKWRRCEQKEAAQLIASHLGLSISQYAAPIPKPDIIELVCKDKRMSVEAFKLFNPTATTRGRNKRPVARVPVYNERGETHSYFDFAPGEKGWYARGDGMSGMFFPGELPQPGETWQLTEGGKDPAALKGLGYNAAGMPTSYLDAKYAKLFEGCHIVIVHDLDSAG